MRRNKSAGGRVAEGREKTSRQGGKEGERPLCCLGRAADVRIWGAEGEKERLFGAAVLWAFGEGK